MFELTAWEDTKAINAICVQDKVLETAFIDEENNTISAKTSANGELYVSPIGRGNRHHERET
jgi:hypothetical protein